MDLQWSAFVGNSGNIYDCLYQGSHQNCLLNFIKAKPTMDSVIPFRISATKISAFSSSKSCPTNFGKWVMSIPVPGEARTGAICSARQDQILGKSSSNSTASSTTGTVLKLSTPFINHCVQTIQTNSTNHDTPTYVNQSELTTPTLSHIGQPIFYRCGGSRPKAWRCFAGQLTSFQGSLAWLRQQICGQDWEGRSIPCNTQTPPAKAQTDIYSNNRNVTMLVVQIFLYRELLWIAELLCST